MSGKPCCPRPARLFVGVGVAAAGLLLGLAVPRLVPLAPPSRAANESAASALPAAGWQDRDVDSEMDSLDHVWVIPSAPLAAEGEKLPLAPAEIDTARKESLAASLPPTEGYKADRAFEQRLKASEEDLRSQLFTVAEVRLVSDAEVQRIRAAQRTAQEAVPGSAAALQAAQRQLKECQDQLLEVQRSGMTGFAYDQVRYRYDQIVRAYQDLARTYREGSPECSREQEKIDHKFNLRLHQDLARAAVGAGLGLESGPDCQLDPSTAAEVQKLSKELRDWGFVTVARASAGGAPRPGVSRSDGAAAPGKVTQLQSWCDQQHLESKTGTTPTLTQMLQVEDEATRLVLVRELTRIDSEEATTSLAVRAIADLSLAVRQAAVAGLQGRPWLQYGPVLLRGLRYPWAPVADHAAVAVRTLRPTEAVAPLVGMLDLPSPSRPFLDPTTHGYAVRELVRVNHMRSCLLCHAPSANKDDGLVRGRVPTPGEPLPQAYYEAETGNFVRADITYLRQDFSVPMADQNAAPWPREQRYDFLTRLRRNLTPQETAHLRAPPAGYPQREALLYALRGLTGKDGGASSARWRELLGLGASKPEEKAHRPVPEDIPVSTPGPDRPR
jgi:hypothetical protein